MCLPRLARPSCGWVRRPTTRPIPFAQIGRGFTGSCRAGSAGAEHDDLVGCGLGEPDLAGAAVDLADLTGVARHLTGHNSNRLLVQLLASA